MIADSEKKVQRFPIAAPKPHRFVQSLHKEPFAGVTVITTKFHVGILKELFPSDEVTNLPRSGLLELMLEAACIASDAAAHVTGISDIEVIQDILLIDTRTKAVSAGYATCVQTTVATEGAIRVYLKLADGSLQLIAHSQKTIIDQALLTSTKSSLICKAAVGVVPLKARTRYNIFPPALDRAIALTKQLLLQQLCQLPLEDSVDKPLSLLCPLLPLHFWMERTACQARTRAGDELHVDCAFDCGTGVWCIWLKHCQDMQPIAFLALVLPYEIGSDLCRTVLRQQQGADANVVTECDPVLVLTASMRDEQEDAAQKAEAAAQEQGKGRLRSCLIAGPSTMCELFKCFWQQEEDSFDRIDVLPCDGPALTTALNTTNRYDAAVVLDVDGGEGPLDSHVGKF